MSKFVVVSGDTVTFESSFGPVAAPATLQPPLTTTITGTGMKLKSGAIACVKGDESSVTLSGVKYTTAAFSATPGVGTLKISGLGNDQTAQKLTVGEKNVILVGSKFDATFTVVTGAMNAVPQSDPPGTIYSGKGSFSTSDTKIESA
jgi:hypothetical protein